jgi:hypothetical protein
MRKKNICEVDGGSKRKMEAQNNGGSKPKKK